MCVAGREVRAGCEGCTQATQRTAKSVVACYIAYILYLFVVRSVGHSCHTHMQVMLHDRVFSFSRGVHCRESLAGKA